MERQRKVTIADIVKRGTWMIGSVHFGNSSERTA